MNLIRSAIIAATMASVLFAAEETDPAQETEIEITAYANQVGFLSKGSKQMALVGAENQEVVFKNSVTNETALTVTAPQKKFWGPAGDSASLVDFSELTVPGTYQAYIGDKAVGHPVIVADNALESVAKASLKFYYFQRASTALTEEFAGEYARAAGHPDTAVKYHESTGHINDNTTIRASKGWYDAGDYGKYVVNSGITTYTLLQLYQHNKVFYDTLNLNIPESKNNVPDILDEIRWNLEWMLAMQDSDGGVFHKLTTKNFAGMVMPAKATAQRYVIGKAAEATWNFAAVMTLASEIYYPYDPEFSQKCIEAAVKAQDWGTKNSSVSYSQPSGVYTGSYENATAWTSRFWTHVEMYRLYKNPISLAEIYDVPINTNKASLQNWQNNYMLGLFSIATNASSFGQSLVDSVKTIICAVADKYVSSLEDNGYGVALGMSDFYWGSNSVAANKGMVLIHAYILTKNQKYLNAALSIADYLLGRNPIDKSYLTGFGFNPVMQPHHRPSEADGIVAPVPGMLAGGPNASADDCAKKMRNPKAPAKSYLDSACSYATNEVAINWNAPFAYLLGSIQAIAATGLVYDVTTAPKKTYEKLNLVPMDATTEAIAVQKLQSKAIKVGFRKVVKDNRILIEHVSRDGQKQYFDLKGFKIK